MSIIPNNTDGTIRKLKGDIGVSIVTTVLLENGLNVLLPYGDRLPYDLVVERNGVFKRIQVKYINTKKNGIANVKLKKRASSTIEYNKNTIDGFAIYCPITKIIAFINMSEVNINYNGLYIRFRDILINIKSKVIYAKSITNPLRIFDSNIIDKYISPNDLISVESQVNTNKKIKIKRLNASKERVSRRKVVRPSKEELEKLVWEVSTKQLAKEMGVSDNAIGKWCKIYGISKPPRGYWQKIKYNDIKPLTQ